MRSCIIEEGGRSAHKLPRSCCFECGGPLQAKKTKKGEDLGQGEQRTAAWHAEREHRLTASAFGNALGCVPAHALMLLRYASDVVYTEHSASSHLARLLSYI